MFSHGLADDIPARSATVVAVFASVGVSKGWSGRAPFHHAQFGDVGLFVHGDIM